MFSRSWKQEQFHIAQKSLGQQSYKAIPSTLLMVLLSSVGSTAWAADQRLTESGGDKMGAIMTQLLDVGTLGNAATIPLEAPKSDTQSPAVDMVTLGRSLALASEHSDELRAAEASARGARWVARSTAGRYGPRIDLQIQKGREYSQSSGTAAEVSRIDQPYHTRTDSYAMLRQPLVDVPTLQAARRDARLAEGASAQQAQTRTDVFFDTAQAFDQLLQFQLLVGLAKEHRERLQSLLGYMTRREAGGGATSADRNRVYAMTLTADRDMVDARSQYERAQIAYMRLTGVRPESLVVTPNSSTTLPETSQAALDQMISASPALLALRKQMEAAGLDRSSTRAGLLPKLAIEAGDYRQRNASGVIGATHDQRVMLVLSMNLLNGGSEYSANRAQTEQLIQLQSKYDDTLAKARERLTVNYLTLDSIRSQLSIAREENKANTQVATAFDAQLAAANRSLLDVLDTYQKLYQSRVNVVKLFVAERQATYQVLKDVGTMATLESNGGDNTPPANGVPEGQNMGAPANVAPVGQSADMPAAEAVPEAETTATPAEAETAAAPTEAEPEADAAETPIEAVPEGETAETPMEAETAETSTEAVPEEQNADTVQ